MNFESIILHVWHEVERTQVVYRSEQQNLFRLGQCGRPQLLCTRFAAVCKGLINHRLGSAGRNSVM